MIVKIIKFAKIATITAGREKVCFHRISPNQFFLVAVPPDILDYPTSTDMVVTEGSNVTLRCAATGDFNVFISAKTKNAISKCHE